MEVPRILILGSNFPFIPHWIAWNISFFVLAHSAHLYKFVLTYTHTPCPDDVWRIFDCSKHTQTEKKSNAILIKYQCNTNKILKSTALEYFISVALNAILMQYYGAIYRLVLHWYCIETYYVRSISLVLHLSDKLQIVLH